MQANFPVSETGFRYKAAAILAHGKIQSSLCMRRRQNQVKMALTRQRWPKAASRPVSPPAPMFIKSRLYITRTASMSKRFCTVTRQPAAASSGNVVKVYNSPKQTFCQTVSS